MSTVAKSLSESSRFASQYLKESCKTTDFATITFLTVFCGYLSSILSPTIQDSILSRIMYLLLSAASVGGAMWCLTSLTYIILETTRCMHPEISIEAASNYASRKLSYATLKKVYLSIWMGKYSDILDEHLKHLKNIHKPSQYFSRELFRKTEGEDIKPSELIINLPKEIIFHLGYRDYELSELEKINCLLEVKNAELYLAPQGFCSKEFGALYSKETCDDVYNTIRNKLSSIYRFKRDDYIEEEKNFWNEHYLTLHRALSRAIKHYDMAQFRKYLESIEGIHIFFRRARKNRIIRKYLKPDYDKYRYLLLYSKSVKWLLESIGTIEEDVIELFLYALIESVEGQVEEDIKGGDWCTLDELKWIVTDTYQLFRDLVKDKNSRLWELRARIGGFYDFAGDLLSQHQCDINKEDKTQIQLVLHKGIIKWLLIAIENENNELVNSLCEATRKMVFPDGVVFTPKRLVTQHFILCGKMLEFLMSEPPKIFPNVFKLLCFDKYEHTAQCNIDYDDLVKFFIESRKGDLKSFLHEFSSTDWKRNPLSGGGHGTPTYTFRGNIELDYMFIYLALLRLPFLADVQPIAFEFRGYNLKDKIYKFKAIVRGIDVYSFKDSKEKLEEWLDACDALYKQKEEERVAGTPLSHDIVSQYKDSFWKGYTSYRTFLGFCMNKGYYSINNEAGIKGSYKHDKDIYINKRRSSQSIAERDGAEISKYHDTVLLKSIINPENVDKALTTEDIVSMLDQACQWLTDECANRETGILLVCGCKLVQSELCKREDFTPSWKIDNNLIFHGLRGYYKIFPLIEIHDLDSNPKCVAFNLKDWKGIQIRSDVLDKGIFGYMNIREWTDEEINEAIHNKKIKEEDRNRVKSECLVEYELYWQLDTKNLPIQMAVLLSKDDNIAIDIP
ncbi:MAG: hypothetical protein ACFFCW_40620 [Candidatus Hodarchaeota archaeon]